MGELNIGWLLKVLTEYTPTDGWDEEISLSREEFVYITDLIKRDLSLKETPMEHKIFGSFCFESGEDIERYFNGEPCKCKFVPDPYTQQRTPYETGISSIFVRRVTDTDWTELNLNT